MFSDTFAHGLTAWQASGEGWRWDGSSLIYRGQQPAQILVGRPDWAHYAVDVRFIADGSAWPEDAYWRLLVRARNDGRAYAAEFSQAGVALVMLQPGAPPLRFATMSESWSGGPHVARLAVTDSDLVLQLDGRLLLQAPLPEPAVAAGVAGLADRGIPLAVDAVQVLSIDTTDTTDATDTADTTDGRDVIGGARTIPLPRSALLPPPGYLPLGAAQAGGARDILLVYSGYYASGAGEWRVEDALPYVGHQVRGADGTVHYDDWFFDTALFLGLQAPSGRAFDSPARGAPAHLSDWAWYLDHLFAPDAQLAAFDEAVARVGAALGQPDHTLGVVVMIPTPLDVADFGRLPDGTPLDLHASGRPAKAVLQARLHAISWYLQAFFDRWQAARFSHLKLLGFYWLDEAVSPTDPLAAPLVRATADLLHAQGWHFYWIPWFEAPGYDQAADLGFDAALLQPNYMFNLGLSRERLVRAAQDARRNGLGIEVEADDSVLSSASGRARYLEYLRAGVQEGYMTGALHAYYQGVKLLKEAADAPDPAVRAVYDATYAFVRGRFSISGWPPA